MGRISKSAVPSTSAKPEDCCFLTRVNSCLEGGAMEMLGLVRREWTWSSSCSSRQSGVIEAA
ncbi:rCG50926, isoform CRA_b [Rattus norvegicus]|uniref:RCG50926, isoform CRA_b n=1 Tax=Rattus norvegicus TaxID=10116 RepID=A6KJ36_RAT|nr:rCG50926, isoform CRA_b [Rattus norvegicus]